MRGHVDVMFDRFGQDRDVHLPGHGLYNLVRVKDPVHRAIIVHVKTDRELAKGAVTVRSSGRGYATGIWCIPCFNRRFERNRRVTDADNTVECAARTPAKASRSES